MVNAVEAFDAKHMKPAEEIPAFRPGDTVDVNVKIQEGNNSRIQTFTGVVIARKGAGVRETFVVRKISFGTGVERRFPVHSPSRAVCAAPSCTTCALCAVRPLVLPSAATTPLSESIRGCNREPDDAGTRINREIQPGTVSVSGCFRIFHV